MPSALFSLPQLQAALGPRVWQISRTIALEYIALVFAFDFIFLPLREGYDPKSRSWRAAVVAQIADIMRNGQETRGFGGAPDG
jgi:hypothetical protein